MMIKKRRSHHLRHSTKSKQSRQANEAKAAWPLRTRVLRRPRASPQRARPVTGVPAGRRTWQAAAAHRNGTTRSRPTAVPRAPLHHSGKGEGVHLCENKYPSSQVNRRHHPTIQSTSQRFNPTGRNSHRSTQQPAHLAKPGLGLAHRLRQPRGGEQHNGGVGGRTQE